ncbi:SAYSvFN domain-containing protein 1 [Zonotrichia albicollis]|uniref:SAYSvFN domain-containing protein 1 n=1 Tax=Zonotrichia albicollis TaxID=44394 RepID=UPI003D80D06B
MAATVERRLAEFRAARRSAAAAPRPAEPPGKAAAPEAAEGPRAAAEGPGGGAQVRPGAAAAPVWARPLLLKVLLWAVLLALFAELELGLPYFVLSLLYWMYAGTRGPAERRPGELSAYSVFNPGCAAIAGTLTAEQLERELHYRPAAGRRRPVPNKAVAKPALSSRFLGPGSCSGTPRGTALSQLRLPARHLQGFSSRELCRR